MGGETRTKEASSADARLPNPPEIMTCCGSPLQLSLDSFPSDIQGNPLQLPPAKLFRGSKFNVAILLHCGYPSGLYDHLWGTCCEHPGKLIADTRWNSSSRLAQHVARATGNMVRGPRKYVAKIPLKTRCGNLQKHFAGTPQRRCEDSLKHVRTSGNTLQAPSNQVAGTPWNT